MSSETQMCKRPSAADDDDDGFGGKSEPLTHEPTSEDADANEPASAEVKAVPTPRTRAARSKPSNAAPTPRKRAVKQRPAGTMVRTKLKGKDKTPQQSKQNAVPRGKRDATPVHTKGNGDTTPVKRRER